MEVLICICICTIFFLPFCRVDQQFPNIVGFVFGIVQMVLYIFYKNAKKVLEQPKLQELSGHIIDVGKLSTMVCPEVLNQIVLHPNDVGDVNILGDESLKEKIEETKARMDDVVSVQV